MKTKLKSLTLLAAIIAAPAWSAPGDQEITIVVPVSLTNISPTVTSYGVQCMVVDNVNGSVSPNSPPFGNAATIPLQNGAGSNQFTVKVNVPGQLIPKMKGYVCQVIVSDGASGTAMGPGLDPNGPFWYSIPAPNSPWKVFGSLLK
jgi:hypothetical protein